MDLALPNYADMVDVSIGLLEYALNTHAILPHTLNVSPYIYIYSSKKRS